MVGLAGRETGFSDRVMNLTNGMHDKRNQPPSIDELGEEEYLVVVGFCCTVARVSFPCVLSGHNFGNLSVWLISLGFTA